MNKNVFKLRWIILAGLILISPLSYAKNNKETSLAQASEHVRESTKGKIISAKTINQNGRRTHKIQVLTPSGRVKLFRVPMNSVPQNNSQNNSQMRKNAPSSQDIRNNSVNPRRSQYRDRPMHNSRLNTQPQTINPRSRTQTSRPTVRENRENGKRK